MYDKGWPPNESNVLKNMYLVQNLNPRHFTYLQFSINWAFDTLNFWSIGTSQVGTLTVETVTSRRKVVSTNEHLFTGWHSNIERPEIKSFINPECSYW